MLQEGGPNTLIDSNVIMQNHDQCLVLKVYYYKVS